MGETFGDNPLQRLAAAGQSIWYDNIRRSLLLNGGLAQMMARDAVTGVTSNPTIFMKAIAESTEYDEAISYLARQDVDATQTLDILMAQDIQMAADILQPAWAGTYGRDGYVSIEVDPSLARDAEGTVAEAHRLAYLVDRPNVLVKVPATVEGVEAFRQLTGLGACINVTLIFSLERYRQVVEAYISGLEELAARLDAGEQVPPLSAVASVASFFVSRVDTLIDSKLDAMAAAAADKGDAEGPARFRRLRGKAAVANAKLAYQHFLTAFSGPRWEALQARGARVQRPLWASTSTKDPAYRDVIYAEELIGPQTVNTMPQVLLDGFRDHGVIAATLTSALAEAREMPAALEEAGISLDAVTAQLEVDGVKAFADSFQALAQAVQAKHSIARQSG